jgi:hypothetical protein
LPQQNVSEYEIMEGKEFRDSVGGLVAIVEDGKKVLKVAN